MDSTRPQNPKPRRYPPLGGTQRDVLRALIEHGGVWTPGCGWYWQNTSKTISVFISLAARGLVISEELAGNERNRPRYRFTVTDAGRAAKISL